MLKIFLILKLTYFDPMVGVNLPVPYLNNFFFLPMEFFVNPHAATLLTKLVLLKENTVTLLRPGFLY